MNGVIRGRTNNGRLGRIVLHKDGSMTFHNVIFEGIVLRDCDLEAESGAPRPIAGYQGFRGLRSPHANGMTVLEDWADQCDRGNKPEPVVVDGLGGRKVKAA